MPRHLGRGSSPIPEFHSPKNTEQVDSEQVSERQGGENV